MMFRTQVNKSLERLFEDFLLRFGVIYRSSTWSLGCDSLTVGAVAKD
jgi:hypothetical protein